MRLIVRAHLRFTECGFGMEFALTSYNARSDVLRVSSPIAFVISMGICLKSGEH